MWGNSGLLLSENSLRGVSQTTPYCRVITGINWSSFSTTLKLPSKPLHWGEFCFHQVNRDSSGRSIYYWSSGKSGHISGTSKFFAVWHLDMNKSQCKAPFPVSPSDSLAASSLSPWHRSLPPHCSWMWEIQCGIDEKSLKPLQTYDIGRTLFGIRPGNWITN